MSKRHKNFGSPVNSDELEPITFELYNEEFTARPAIQGATLLGFMREADSGEGGRAADALLGFFEKVLLEESYLRFNQLVEDPDRVVQFDVLTEIVTWLVEVYTERPTKGSKGS